jgi:adenylosuccinate synthase
MDQEKLAVIVGGYLGDEGKGKATQFYMGKYSDAGLHKKGLCIRSSGGTNTGASIYVKDSSEKEVKLSIHMLPVGAFQEGFDSYIGNAVYINMEVLLREAHMRRTVLGDQTAGKVYISRCAHVVTEYCVFRDNKKEETQQLGSTKNGVSIAASDKYSYKGITIEKFLKENPTWAEKLAQHEVQIVDPYEFMSEASKTHNMVLEGTQGVGLDVNHGAYPYVSSGSFSTFGLLDGVGYTLAPTDVCMVLKAYGSYFGPTREAGHFEDDNFRQFAGEYGTTTKRPRNLSWLDMRQVQRSASLTRPTCIMLNCLDKLDYFPKHGKKWAIIIDNEQRVEFDDAPMANGKLTQAGAFFVETIEEYARAPVKFLGIGPKHTDIIER